MVATGTGIANCVHLPAGFHSLSPLNQAIPRNTGSWKKFGNTWTPIKDHIVYLESLVLIPCVGLLGHIQERCDFRSFVRVPAITIREGAAELPRVGFLASRLHYDRWIYNKFTASCYDLYYFFNPKSYPHRNQGPNKQDLIQGDEILDS